MLKISLFACFPLAMVDQENPIRGWGMGGANNL